MGTDAPTTARQAPQRVRQRRAAPVKRVEKNVRSASPAPNGTPPATPTSPSAYLRRWDRLSENLVRPLAGQDNNSGDGRRFAAHRGAVRALVPHRYTAVTQILIDPTDLRAVGNDLNSANQANDASVLQVESQVRVLISDSVLRRVVGTEALDHDPEFVGRPSAMRGLMASFGLGGARNADPTLSALNALKGKLQVKRAERTYVVDVSVTAREPAKAARIANAVAQAYLAEQTEVRSDAARQVSQSLSARLNELKDRVRHAEDRIEEVQSAQQHPRCRADSWSTNSSSPR